MFGENTIYATFVIKCEEDTFIEFYSDVMTDKRTANVKIRYVGNIMYGYFAFHRAMDIEEPYNSTHNAEYMKAKREFKEQKEKEFNKLFDELYDFVKKYTNKFTGINDKTFIGFNGDMYCDSLFVYDDVTTLETYTEITDNDRKRMYGKRATCLYLSIPQMVEDAEFDKYREILNSRICDKTEKNYVFKQIECAFISYEDMVKLFANYGYAVEMYGFACTLNEVPQIETLLARHFNDKTIMYVDDRRDGYYITMRNKD